MRKPAISLSFKKDFVAMGKEIMTNQSRIKLINDPELDEAGTEFIISLLSEGENAQDDFWNLLSVAGKGTLVDLSVTFGTKSRDALIFRSDLLLNGG
jgi:hypothetical protein